jgi:hypothetical protein
MVGCVSLLGGCKSSPPPPAPDGGSAAALSDAGTPAIKTGHLVGTATLAGTPPVMKVPSKRRDADHCKSKEILYNSVLVRDGKLRDVFVRLAGDIPVPTTRPAPERPAVLRQVDCTYEPRIQGAVVGMDLEAQNADLTRHNIHLMVEGESVWGTIQDRTVPFRRELYKPGIFKALCDIHPWMRAFVIVSTHPYYGVTGDNGEVTLKDMPAGEYDVEAWHSHYGWKRLPKVAIRAGEATRVEVAYSTTDPAPPENEEEHKDLW